MLDEPEYSWTTVIAIGDADYISIFCAYGKLKEIPNDIVVMRFDMELAEAKPGTQIDWSKGTIVNVERHGNFYRINEPVPESIYVARTVWDHGVLEYGWVVVQ